MITRSDRLDHVHSDIRGPLYQEALRMESEGVNVLKLNTGNPGRFGFKLPNSVRQALALHIDEAVPYCDVRGMAAARNVICTYHIGRGLQGIMPNDVFICNGVSEAASMLMNALIGTGDEILLPSPCYSLWSNNAYLCGGKPVFYRCDPNNEWNPDIDDINSKITDRTKAILVINPNNPTGAVYSKEVLLAIAEVLFSLPTDMKRFRSLTLGGTVILGRRTLDSFPGGKPLPKRRNIVITHCPDFSREGAETVSSLAAMREATAGTPPDQLWVIGGGSIYAALLSQCARAYVTRVDAAAEGADSFFPNLDKLPGWTVRAVSEPVTENGLTYRFYDYVNTKLCD